MKKAGLIGIGVLLAVILICALMTAQDLKAASNSSGVKTVSKVELSRYLGKWYEIASIPQSFQKQCAFGTTATYSLRSDGDVAVLNQCYTSEGKLSKANGRAWVADKSTNAKLKVTFIPWLKWNFLAGDYWVIDLGPNYEYAVVGHPSRGYGWILSRTPELPKDTLDGIVKRLKDQGYDFSKFKMTDQKRQPPK
jgi:apolipoprotein D and lipocalin family protein